MKKYFIFMICMITLLNVSCKESSEISVPTPEPEVPTPEDPAGQIDGGGFISQYYVTDYVILKEEAFNHPYPTSGVKSFEIPYKYDMCSSLNLEDEGYAKFMEYAKRFNDLSYNDRVSEFYNISLPKLDYINIRCKSDYNDKYKAGDLMNDIVKAKFITFYDFVQNGYTYDGLTQESGSAVGGCVDDTLDNINKVGYQLVTMDSLSFSIVEFADVDGNYKFECEISVDGNVAVGELRLQSVRE